MKKLICNMIILCCFSMVSSLSLADTSSNNHNPLCDADVLSIHLIASTYPGMSKSIETYAIVNHGKKTCRIRGYPQVWALTEKGRAIKMQRHQFAWHNKPNYITLKPVNNKTYQYARNVVFFNIYGDGAHMPEDPGYIEKFSKIQIMLPETKHNQGNYKAAYQGNTTSAAVGYIKNDLSHWHNVYCRVENKKKARRIQANDKIEFNHVLQCG